MTPSPQPPRAAIYARFSSDLQNARSAEDQARVCREHADRQGWQVVDVFSDLAISGTSNNRPGLNAALAAAEAGSVDIILAEALDRISRHQADIATIYKRLEFADVRLATVSEGDIAELQIGMLGTMNAIFVKELGKKIRRGQKGAVTRGRTPGGLAYGYEPAPVLLPNGEVERGHRRIVPAQADVIRRIFTDYRDGLSPKAIAHQLNHEGITAPRTTEWRASTINGSRGRMNGILGNPAYVGRIAYNRVRMVKDPETRRRVSRVNDAADHLFAEAPDLRIVDQALWDEVQALRDSRSGGTFNRQKRPRHLFSGIVNCGTCGGTYAVISKDRWGCTRHREAGSCQNGQRIATGALERRVLGGLQEKLLAPDVVSAVVKRYHDQRAAHRREHERQLAAATDRVEELKGEIARLVDALAAGAAYDEIKIGIADRREQMAIAEAQLAEHQALPPIILHPQVVEAYRRRIGMLGKAITAGEHARRFLPQIRALIETITLSPASHEPDKLAIEVGGSLATVLALATGNPMPISPPAKGPRTVQVVAKDRYSLGSRLRTFSA